MLDRISLILVVIGAINWGSMLPQLMAPITTRIREIRSSIFFNSFNGFNDSMDGNEKNMRVSNRKFRIMNCKLRESRNQFYLFYEK